MKRILQRRGWLRWGALVLGISLPLVMLISVPWGVGEPGPSSNRISVLNFQNADMQSVLSFLADYGGVNIVSGPAVDISVTLSLQNVTWRQALDILLKTYSLTGVEENGYIRVLPTPEFLQEQALLEKRRAEQISMVSLETAVIPVKHGTAGDMVRSIKQVVSQRGSIDTDERTNSVVVRDTPEHIEKVLDMT